MANGGNGWRSGTDPILRWLRAAAILTFLAVFVLVALDAERDVTTEIPVLGLAGGAALILLGYERLVRLPGIDRRDDE